MEHIIEAILFVSGEPVDIKKLIKHTGSKREEIEKSVARLAQNLSERGIRLLRKDNYVTLVSAPEASGALESMAKENFEGDLSRQALETLAVILWHGETNRAAIDYIRGVNSSFTLKTLLVRGLIERVTHKTDSRIYIYRPTMDLLRHLGINSLDELPQFNTIKKKLKEYD